MPPIANLAYLVAAVLFILAFKGLAHPRTAVRGNMLGSIGMLVAILATLRYAKILSWEAILAGLVLGSAIGAVLAIKVEMTAMPQLVALLNGFGGGASVFVAGAALLDAGSLSDTSPLQLSISSVLSGMIGSVTFFGSLVAFAKLQGIGFVKDLRFGGQQVINAALLLVAIGCAVPIVMSPEAAMWYWGVVGASALLGLLVVLPIGGADMPVVICLLNSYSGLAASATGFALGNNGLIISGSLVGASGLILTKVMCKAMNRSMTNVLFGVMAAGSGPDADTVYAGKVKATSPDEVAMLLDGAQRVVIVPGYGMAVAQAQHVVRDLMNLLEAAGTTVEFGIHPVAGRMPGHMNVLLAEADVPYDKLIAMEEINPSMAQVDIAIVIGANDVVNPDGRTNPDSPIAGMPIIDVDKARTVVVVKRSLSPGFAGIPNPLFAAPNTLMMFGDGKKVMMDLVAAIKEA